ncbi:hypothetical protein EDB89DRAFT_1620648 [Lactarius sanguifluus]|nr:hypothetical protein EDB89DRAFT_1620648 [Lactarius sanguifluus]
MLHLCIPHRGSTCTSQELGVRPSPRVATSPDGPSYPKPETLLLKPLGGLSEDGDDRCGPPCPDRVIPSWLSPRANCARHLVRMAAEYSHLLYHVTKAQIDTQFTFVDEIQWIYLEHLFSDTAIALSTGKLPEDDKAKRMADLTEHRTRSNFGVTQKTFSDAMSYANLSR